MFQKVLRYTGRHRKTTYASILVLVAGVAMSVLPYFFLYRLLRPLLTGGSLTLEETLFNAGAMALCMVLYSLLYVEGLALSHRSAYHTLENLRLHLQSKLEKQPLGAIQEKGVGVWKKMFIDDIESMELLLAHALPEGLSNLAVPVVVFAAMFLTDWKLGLLSLCSLPLGVLAMGMMYRSGMSKMGDYYAAGQKMNNTIVEYINGMEVVKVFNRDGESYHRFETVDGPLHQHFALRGAGAAAGRRLSGTHRRLYLAGLRAGIVHVFFRGTASDPSHELYVGAAPAELQDRPNGISVQYSAPERRKNGFQRKRFADPL